MVHRPQLLTTKTTSPLSPSLPLSNLSLTELLLLLYFSCSWLLPSNLFAKNNLNVDCSHRLLFVSLLARQWSILLAPARQQAISFTLQQENDEDNQVGRLYDMLKGCD